MSRHGGSRTASGLPVFQIEVLDFSRRKNEGIKTIGGNTHARRAKIDILPEVPQRTLLGRFKDAQSATRWGSRFGSVQSCHKVHTSYYLENIEYLKTRTTTRHRKQKLGDLPSAVQVTEEEFTVNRNLEISRSSMTKETRRIQVDRG